MITANREGLARRFATRDARRRRRNAALSKIAGPANVPTSVARQERIEYVNAWTSSSSPKTASIARPGDFHIDPWRPVARALITHGHSDHARSGSERLCLPARLRADPEETARRGHRDRDRRLWRGSERATACASPSIRPAMCWARRRSGSSIAARSGSPPATTSCRRMASAQPFEPVRCDAFITESTFALPIYRWRAASRGDGRSRPVAARQCRRRPRQRHLRLCARQGAAGDRQCRSRPRADLLSWRGRGDQRTCTARPGVRLPPTRPRAPTPRPTTPAR